MKPISSISSSKKWILIKRAVAVIVTIALILGGVYAIQEITRAKSASARDLLYKSYFDDPKQYDVIYLGTSHVMYGFSPLDMWDESGITSYNMASPTCTMAISYWKLKNLLNYATPSLVVLDGYRASWEGKTYNLYKTHEAFDCFPLSVTKIESIMDLTSDSPQMEEGLEYTRDDQFNLLFPISNYHSRWEELTEEDFHNEIVDTKGAEFIGKISSTIENSQTEESTQITPDMLGVVYLRKIIDECKERNIPLLLTYIPFPIEETYRMEANMVGDIARETGTDYLDLTKLDVINYKTDCADADSHLNVSGQEKVSRYLGKYISENYDIPDRSEDPTVKEEWDSLYRKYRDYKDGFLLEEQKLSPYLMLLENSTCSADITITNPDMLTVKSYKRLITAMFPDYVEGETKNCIAENDERVLTLNFVTDGEEKDKAATIEVYKDGQLFDRIYYEYKRDENGKALSNEISRDED